MTLNSLYRIAEQHNIPVECFQMQQEAAISYMDENGNCYIGMDPMQLENTADEKVKLAHDLGHCVTGSFYNRYSTLDLRGKHEYIANGWAYRKLLPFEKLQQALEDGILNSYELAEYFEVPQNFIEAAWEYYTESVPMN